MKKIPVTENPVAGGGSDEESANQLTLAETYDSYPKRRASHYDL